MTPYRPAELQVFSPPSSTPTAEWAETNRELSTLTSASSGRYSLAQVPFFRPILDALDNQNVERVIVCKSTQIGGTEMVVSWLGRIAAEDPGPAMVVLADEDTANEICERRLQPMFRSTECLNRLIIPAKFGQSQVILRNNFSLTMAWASSIARTASRPIRYLAMDEVNKPGYSLAGAEGDPIGRVTQRTETFPNRKIVLLSTPTTQGDNLDREMQAADELYDWHVPCPLCGAFQPMRFRPGWKYTDESGTQHESGGVVWDDKPEANAAAETARYQCGECRGLWTTAQKNAAVGLGRMVPRLRKTAKPRRVGFYISRVISLFPGGRLDSLVLDFLQSKGEPMKLQSFINNSLGEHWADKIVSSSAEEILSAKCDLQPWEWPQEAMVPVAFVDVQKTGFWYCIRAWARDMRSWLLGYGFIPTWDDLNRLVFDSRFGPQNLPLWRVGIDTGGSTRDDGSSSTEEVYWWIVRNIGRGTQLFPCKGASTTLAGKVHIGKPIETTPSGKPLRMGISIVSIDTDKCKEEYHWRLSLAKDHAPQAAYLHSGTGMDYARQIMAEEKQRNRRGQLEWVKVRSDNHLLDCEAGQMAMVSPELLGGLLMLPNAPAIVQPPQVPRPRPVIDHSRENPFTRGTAGFSHGRRK